ncbi:hypothetical protein KC867_00620, partial [Candidatus Saccharibacteria bacterium]|nr:hypothetical protein [Candidatus Saccharibacteria bacterium]
SFYQGDLLAPLENQKTDNQHFAILANLPYVPEAYKLNQSAMHEPRLAIFGGDDGLDLYRKMFMQLDKYSIQPGIILTESLEFQHNDLSKIANRHNYTLTKTRDLIQQFEPNSLAQPLASF